MSEATFITSRALWLDGIEYTISVYRSAAGCFDTSRNTNVNTGWICPECFESFGRGGLEGQTDLQ
jgi:hypothetical protein